MGQRHLLHWLWNLTKFFIAISLMLRVFCPDHVHLGNYRLIVGLDEGFDKGFIACFSFEQKLGALYHFVVMIFQLL